MEAFAAYVKQPDKRPDLPGVKYERLTEYRRLVRNVFDGTLRQAFPITSEVLSGIEWNQMVDAFMAQHPAQNYRVWKMPHEFYRFVSEMDFARIFNRPYLNDLLYFEWMEIEVFTMPDETLPLFETEGDFLRHRLILNPEFRLIELEYPVFKMAADEARKRKGRYFLLIFRHVESGAVRFVELSPFLALLWQLLSETPLSGYDVLLQLKEQLAFDDVQPMVKLALPFYKDMFVQGGILGFYSSVI